MKFSLAIILTCIATHLIVKISLSENETQFERTQKPQSSSIADSESLAQTANGAKNLIQSETQADELRTFLRLGKQDWGEFMRLLGSVSSRKRTLALQQGLKGRVRIDPVGTLQWCESNPFFESDICYKLLVDSFTEFEESEDLFEAILDNELKLDGDSLARILATKLVESDSDRFKKWLEDSAKNHESRDISLGYQALGNHMANEGVDEAVEFALKLAQNPKKDVIHGIFKSILRSTDYKAGPEFILSLPPDSINQLMVNNLLNPSLSASVARNAYHDYTQEIRDTANRNLALSKMLTDTRETLNHILDIKDERLKEDTLLFINEVLESAENK